MRTLVGGASVRGRIIECQTDKVGSQEASTIRGSGVPSVRPCARAVAASRRSAGFAVPQVELRAPQGQTVTERGPENAPTMAQSKSRTDDATGDVTQLLQNLYKLCTT